MKKFLKTIGYDQTLEYKDRLLYFINLCTIFAASLFLTLYVLYIPFLPAITLHIIYITFSILLYFPLKYHKFSFVRYSMIIAHIVQLTFAVFLWFPYDTGFNLYYFMVPMSSFLIMKYSIFKQRVFAVFASLLSSTLYLISEIVPYDHYMYATSDSINQVFRGITIVTILIPMIYIFTKYAENSYKSHQELEQLAHLDYLTQIYNRRVLYDNGNETFYCARKNHLNYSVLIFDIDYFKRINDHYGHPVGDEVLKALSTLIKRNIRKTDLFSRYGGEEFAILLYNSAKEESQIIAEKLLNLVNDHVFIIDNHHIQITISIGLIHCSDAFESFEHMMKCADNALYKAKEEGRNRIAIGAIYPPTPQNNI